jgi:hypothetical protein
MKGTNVFLFVFSIMIKKISIAAGIAVSLPFLALAQPDANFGGIGATVTSVMQFINSFLVPLVFAVAFLFFIYGMFKFFIMGGASQENRDQGKQLMLWGVIGFVLMVSIWGLVNVVAEGLGFRQEEIQEIPEAPKLR